MSAQPNDVIYEAIYDAVRWPDKPHGMYEETYYESVAGAALDAVLPFIEEARVAERERVTRIIRETPVETIYAFGFRDALLVALGVEDNQPGTTP